MIKVLKLQKAVYVIVLGVIGLIAYQIISMNKIAASIYVLQLSGLLFLIAALWLIYPILFAKKVNEEEVQLDPEKHPQIAEPLTSGQPSVDQ